MNELQIFNYNGAEVRTVEQDGATWWVLKDVCGILEITDTNKTAERIEEDELTRIKLVSGGQSREMLCINESGLYNVILRSDKPQAKPFRKWVTSEVLPSIRKHGAYSISPDKKTLAEAKLNNSRARVASMWLKVSALTTPEYKQVCASYASTVLSGGKEVIALPSAEEKLYTATEVGAMFGVSSQRIGLLSTQHSMKTEALGKWFYDKSRYSDKQVQTFKYNQRAVEQFKKLLRA